MLVDSLKLLAYNAEEWLLDILAKKYNDLRDFRRVLLLIMKQPGIIQRIDNRVVIQLHSLHNLRYQRAAGQSPSGSSGRRGSEGRMRRGTRPVVPTQEGLQAGGAG